MHGPPTPVTGPRRRKLLAALRRVDEQLRAWDELDAPAPPHRPSVAVPALDREQLESLRAELLGALGEPEAG